MIETLMLYAFAGLALVGAVLMLVLRHPMRVALALITTMLALGGIYGLLGVHAIAVFQIMIYVSAVMVFMVYVIMLIDIRDDFAARRYGHLVIFGVGGVVLLVATLGYGVWHGLAATTTVSGGAQFGLKPFSAAFLNEFWFYFELVSVLLIAAVVAALAVVRMGFKSRG